MQQSRGAAAEETPPANHIHPEAAKVAFEIEFPVVEGYQDPGIVKVEVDWDRIGDLLLDPKTIPDETLLRALVAADGHSVGYAPGDPIRLNLDEWRKGVRLQQIAFNLAKVLALKWKEERGDSAVARLSADMVQRADRAAREAMGAQKQLRERVAELEGSLELKQRDIDTLSRELDQLRAELTSNTRALESEKQLRELDLTQAAGRTRNLLAGRLKLLLSYLPIAPAGLRMPVENDNITVSNRKFFCVDPSDGTAIFEFAKPRAAGLVQISDDRETICVGTLPVDPNERPLLERLECEMRIDHDYVAHVTLRSQGRQENSQLEFHQLDFGLTLPTDFGGGNGPDQDDTHSPDNGERVDGEQSKRSSTLSAALQSNITLRSNLVPTDDHSRATTADWRMVPGDLVERWRTDFLGPRLSELSQMQMDERDYLPCVR
jgi:hypothetical protein